MFSCAFIFHRYDRYMSKVKSAGSPSKASPQSQPPIPPPQRPPQQTPEVSLIDLADDTPSAQLASLSKRYCIHHVLLITPLQLKIIYMITGTIKEFMKLKILFN